MGFRRRALEDLEGLGGVPSSLPDPRFWAGRTVLLTGHTGFKGSWAALWLHRLGARVTGLALPPAEPGLHGLARVADTMDSRMVDIRDQAAIAALLREARPEILLHMAAQPLVRRSLADPVESFAVNVLGTVNLLQALREMPPRAVLVVTTDKVYAPPPAPRAHPEIDPLGGADPYAASKAACEIATASMARNFLEPAGTRVATARAGNVIGGGDFAPDRLIPDIIRASQPPTIRHPTATRPWQHVLDCLCGYLLYAEALAQGRTVPPALNFGPAETQPATVGTIAAAILAAMDRPPTWVGNETTDARETHELALDSSLARKTLNWRDRLGGPAMIETTAAWYRAWMQGADMHDFTRHQIAAYEAMT